MSMPQGGAERLRRSAADEGGMAALLDDRPAQPHDADACPRRHHAVGIAYLGCTSTDHLTGFAANRALDDRGGLFIWDNKAPLKRTCSCDERLGIAGDAATKPGPLSTIHFSRTINIIGRLLLTQVRYITQASRRTHWSQKPQIAQFDRPVSPKCNFGEDLAIPQC